MLSSDTSPGHIFQSVDVGASEATECQNAGVEGAGWGAGVAYPAVTRVGGSVTEECVLGKFWNRPSTSQGSDQEKDLAPNHSRPVSSQPQALRKLTPA